MRRVATLCCFLGVLICVLVWELVAPEPDANDPAPAAAVSATGPLETATAKPGKPVPHAFDADALTGVTASITERPLFSPGRRPSREVAKAVAAGPTTGALPRLTGILVGPAGGRAIFAGADGKSHTAAEGDAIGDFKIRAIDPGAVTVSGSEGDRVLRPTFVTSPGASIASPDSIDLSLSTNGAARPRDRAR
jgi:hypothetical protein